MKNEYYANRIPSEGTLHAFENERDACGTGFIAAISGEKTNTILNHGLDSICRMMHRGALAADGKTGDGCGIAAQIPAKLFRPVLAEKNIRLKNDNDLGVGVFFLPHANKASQMKVRILAESIAREQKLIFIAWRKVPVNVDALGAIAQKSMPEILHMLVQRPVGTSDEAFERKLYLCRRKIIRLASEENISDVYVPSFSHRLIIYKALAAPTALRLFYDDLRNPDFETAICLFHQRYSTNTFPSWSLAQPFRMLAHNGEINTIRGNRNWMRSRETIFASERWGKDSYLLHDLCSNKESDSATLDAVLELLVLSGRSLEHAMSMLVPPAWENNPDIGPDERAFYQYHSAFMEPWDGPAALVFTDGKTVCAALDRNGLRPMRYKITKDGLVIAASEQGTIDIPDDQIVSKGRLGPGQMFSVNTVTSKVSFDAEIKQNLARRQPYREWIQENQIALYVTAGHGSSHAAAYPPEELFKLQIAFGYSAEEMEMGLIPMIKGAEEAIYSMGDDTPLAVLSTKPRLLFSYFKQTFAQVTNPPIDPIRERNAMSISTGIGAEQNLLSETPEHARVVRINSPVLFPEELQQIKELGSNWPYKVISTLWSLGDDGNMDNAIARICGESEEAVDAGAAILILSDKGVSETYAALPALLSVGAVHQHLTRFKKRLRISIILESGEVRDSHHLACVLAYGATCVFPYLALESIANILETDRKNQFEGLDHATAAKNYRKALEKGLLKIMSKMGISVLNSYQGAQIFEAVGIADSLIDLCFKNTPSKIGGIGVYELAAEYLARHHEAFDVKLSPEDSLKLPDPGYNRFRNKGERHVIDPSTLRTFHAFVKSNDPAQYKNYVEEIAKNRPLSIKDLFTLKPAGDPLSIEEVEPIESIRKRFTTAAMSLGAISPEAHEAIAIAMNRIGGKSDSGEGGEDPKRFKPYANGDWANSKIKQVASGRFGVTAEYLVNAEELEIKMAQGAKPGEGGQLPAYKVEGVIAKLRRTQPGIQLISPPPHHDIYSIEDLAQLIHDLKEINPTARICVKLVAESGVGTIAAGVAKANADIILISGHEGGTGASPLISIKNAGLPWEIGLSEARQVLMLNGMRERVTLRTDGGLRTGLDIVIAAILGAEEFNFGTIALIALGCIYVRKCHLNNCPTGIATTDPEFRAKFKGSPDMLVNFFNAVAQEVREIMAQLGIRKMDDMIGKTALLEQRSLPDHPKADTLNLAPLLKDVAGETASPRICTQVRNDPPIVIGDLDSTIVKDARNAIEKAEPVALHYAVENIHRNIGTKLSGEIARKYGDNGLANGSITLHLAGSAGQSLGTFLCSGVRILLTGEANDYVGKGMCGGEIVLRPPAHASFIAAENAIAGNALLYGATGGRFFANGTVGERFAVRNSGVTAVVEGIGDHGCEYMTNGCVLVIGKTGNNFAAGMSGGIAYVLDEDGKLAQRLNKEMAQLLPLAEEDQATVTQLLTEHHRLTGSAKAKAILDAKAESFAKMKKILPKTK